MKKTSCIAFISSMVIIYLVIIGAFFSNKSTDLVPESVDKQIVSVENCELVSSDGQRCEVTLPAYFDATGETRLFFTLDYAFSGRTTPSLMLQANHTFMTILLDGEEIYHVEPQSYSLGNYFTNIPLPQSAKGAKLEIRVTVPQSGITRVSMPNLIIADETVFLKQHVLADIPSLLLNVSILLSGVILFLLAIVGRKSINPYKMLIRAFLAFNCGLYFMCETYAVVLLAPIARMTYVIDMLSFAILGPPLVILLGWELKDWRRKLLNAIGMIGMLGAVVQVILATFGGVELRKLLPMTHAVQIVGILAVIVCVLYGIVRKKNNSSTYLGALIAVSGAIDIIMFRLEVWQNNVFFLKIALIIYLFIQMHEFVRSLMEQSAKKAMESYYKALAMQDPLSHCKSRSAFELDMEAWHGETVRTAFFLDLNNLKITNDLYGHGAGDQLISAFGDVLNQVFSAVGKSYRVGGDEFWVLCDELDTGEADELICEVQRATDVYNRDNDLPSKISYAIGVCDTVETNGDIKMTIELADERMYENKRQVKESVDL